jgi:hypothetical protein
MERTLDHQYLQAHFFDKLTKAEFFGGRGEGRVLLPVCN